MEVKGKRVFVGLSGGVDSAVTAALLQRAGARVTGVFIKGWYPPGMPCTWASDRRDAMRVAAHLAIPFLTLDASVEYKKSVIEYLLAEYRAGRTPNPDVMCNREVKFGVFYRYAIAQGANYIATGHYVQVEDGTLLRGVDPSKDQSYFLWAVPEAALLHTLFPLGAMHKSDVRALAKRYQLPVAEKKDSQGICFLGAVSVKDFLRHELGDNPALLHTLGEKVEGKYVVAKDIERGTLELGDAPGAVTTSKIEFTDANWLGTPTGELEAQYRYHGPRVPGRVEGSAFTSTEPLNELLAAGQSIVFYKGEQLIGGGTIRAS